MKIHIALCDDNARALPIISGATESAFREKGIQTEIRTFHSGKELLQAMEETAFQLILLDIEMPGMDGIAVGRKIREKGDSTQIVYVSERESRVFESFSVQPLNFVRKSSFLTGIAETAELYVKRCLKVDEEEHLEFTTRSGLLSLKSRQIRYIEGSRNYQLLYLDGRPDAIEVKMTMQKLEELTIPHGFLRIHKGYLVNCHFIQRIRPDCVVLQDGTELPVGRSKAGEIKSQYLAWLGK